MRTLASRIIVSSLLAVGLAGSARGAELAGVSAAVRGTVDLSRANASARAIASGEKVYLDDSLRSGMDSGLQVLLLDETVFTLGANSEIVIDDFVYDSKTGQGKLDANIVQGVFRFVSGKIAKERPQDVELRLPSGTIGIRGTIVAGKVESDGSALVVLLGPGRNSNTQDRPGAVRVTGAGQHVDLVQANWATRIPGPGRAPTAPFPMALSDLDQLANAISVAASPPPEPEVEQLAPGAETVLENRQGRGLRSKAKMTAAKWSGQETAEGSAFSQKFLADAVYVAGVKNVDVVAANTPAMNGVASIDQLNAISTGSATYNRPGMTFGGGGGFDFGFVLDFGLHQASFGMQNITSPILALPPGNGVMLNAVATDFAAGHNGKAIFEIPTSFVFGPVCTPCDVQVDAAVLNKNGLVAREIAAKVKVRAGPLEATADLGHIPGTYSP